MRSAVDHSEHSTKQASAGHVAYQCDGPVFRSDARQSAGHAHALEATHGMQQALNAMDMQAATEVSPQSQVLVAQSGHAQWSAHVSKH